LEEIWKLAVRLANERLQTDAGSPLYRCYEHQGRYKDARRILTRLMEINRAHGDRVNEAVHLNNFAFEYLLEKKWDDAAPYFAKAALIFKDTGQNFDYANARANFWTCRFEAGDFGSVKEAKKELTAHAKTLKGGSSWHSRKPLILQAMLAEKEGRIPQAVRLVKGAIKASARSNTRYADMDKAYLMRLERKEAPSI
jgi:tetratricopeptide (TPR) repeat protein